MRLIENNNVWIVSRMTTKIIIIAVLAAIAIFLMYWSWRTGTSTAETFQGPLEEPNAQRAHVLSPNYTSASVIHSSAPFIYQLHQFMSPEECQHFLQISNNRFERSFVTGKSGSDSTDNVRTSYSCVLKESETAIVRQIEERAAQICRVPITHVEGLQIVRYHPGQKYDPHCDYFHHAKIPNQRYATILVYLNDDFEGGTTRFVDPSVNKEVTPKTGEAVFWYNSWVPPEKRQSGEYYCFKESMHQGSAPTSGVKYAVNIWVRLKPYRGVV